MQNNNYFRAFTRRFGSRNPMVPEESSFTLFSYRLLHCRTTRSWVSQFQWQSDGSTVIIPLPQWLHHFRHPGESSLINYFHLEVSTALVWCHWIFSRYPNAVTGQSIEILIHLIFWLFLNTFLTPPPTGTRPRLLTEWNVLSQNWVHSLTHALSPCLGLCVQSQHYFST